MATSLADIAEATSTPPTTGPKVSKGTSLSSLSAPAPKPGPKPEVKSEPKPDPLPKLDVSNPFSKGVLTKERFTKMVDTVKKFEDQSLKHPFASTEAMLKGTVSYGEWIGEKATEGIIGLARKFTSGKDYDGDAAGKQAQKIFDVIQNLASYTPLGGVTSAIRNLPDPHSEAAITPLLNAVSEVPEQVGDTIYEKTGNALAAAGGKGLTTVLMIDPGLGVKLFKGLTEAVPKDIPKEGEAPAAKKKPNTVKGAFDALAATDPHAARAVGDHLGQADPSFQRYVNRRIKKFTDASEEELSFISREAAKANIAELEANYDEIIKGGTVPGPSRSSLISDSVSRNTVGAPTTRVMMQLARDRAEQFQTRAAAETRSRADMAYRFQMTNERQMAQLRDSAREGIEAIQESATESLIDRQAPSTTKLKVTPKTGSVSPTNLKIVPKTSSVSGRLDVTPKPTENIRPDREDVIYFNNGIPITRQHIEAAFRFAGDLASKVPGVAIAQGKMERLYQGSIDIFNPEAKGEAARAAGAAIAENFFRETADENKIRVQGRQRRDYFLKMGKEAQIDFMDRMEEGRRFEDPVKEAARLGYKAWAESMARQDAKTWAGSGKDMPYEPLDHYLAHMFENPDEAAIALDSLFKHKWGDPRFTQQRGFRDYATARKFGLELEKQGKPNPFKPKTTNPEEIMQARQLQSDIAQLRTELLRDFEKKGIAQRVKPGETKPPEGFSPNRRRSPTGVNYWVKNEMDPLMFNVYDSKSLWNLKGNAATKGVSAAFRGWMAAKNTLVPFKLAWSLFHPVHVTHIDAAAELSRSQELALGNPTAGNIAKAIGKIVTGTPTSPVGLAGIAYRAWWGNPKIGWPLLRVFQGVKDFNELSAGDKAAYRDLTESGLVPARSWEETNNSIRNLRDDILSKSAKMLNPFQLSNAILTGIGYPVYSLWIPTLKIASALKDFKVWRELNPEHTPQQRQEAFRQIARRVESRYGEMDYRSRFMTKWVKDIGVGTNLSLGWNLGFLEQYGGAAKDIIKSGVKGNLGVAEGRMARPFFIANYVTSGLAIGGLMTYWLAGRMPDSFLDYTNPDSGEKDQYGKPIRLNTPFYTHEFSALDKHIEQQGMGTGIADWVKAKGSGLWEMANAAATGVNSLGAEIRDPDDPAYKQFEQTLAFELSEINSISLKAMNLSPEANAGKMRALAIGGFSPAGRYISETVTEGKIYSEYSKTQPKEKPFHAVEFGKDQKKAKEMFKADDPKYDDYLEEIKSKYDMDDKDIHKMQKMFNKDQALDPTVYMFSKLDWLTQRSLLKQMKPEEQELYLAHVSKQKRAKWRAESEK